MDVITRPETRPHPRHRVKVGRGPRLRRGSDCSPQGDVVVRVALGWRGRTYAYVCRGPVMLGDFVEVYAAVAGCEVIEPVVGFGRDGYAGPLKRARKVST